MASPATVVKARIVKEADLTPLIWDGTKKTFVDVPEKYLDQLYVLEDGHGRYAAYLSALLNNLPLFNFFFTYKNFNNPEIFRKQYISINKDAQRTSSKDVAQLYANKCKDVHFINYMKLVNDEHYIAKAAQIISFGREIKKSDYDKIVKEQNLNIDAELVKYMSECYAVYETVFKNLTPQILHSTALAFFTKNALTEEDNDMNAVCKNIVGKFSVLTVPELCQLKNAKKDGNRTKGQVITDILENILKS